MLETISTSLAASTVSLVLVALLTCPSISNIASHFRSGSSSRFEFDEDADGTATAESITSYNAQLPKALLGWFAIAGLSTSVALAVLATIGDGELMLLENWVVVGASVRDHVT